MLSIGLPGKNIIHITNGLGSARREDGSVEDTMIFVTAVINERKCPNEIISTRWLFEQFRNDLGNSK